MKLHNVYFSPKGTTKLCADCIADSLDLERSDYDWLTAKEPEKAEIPSEDVLLFSMPIYGGYIPKLCAERTAVLKGSRTPAIITAVYGNRHYDNALIQMKDLLEKQGFVVIAAGAFLAEHSIFPAVAAGRPDESDKAAMENFAQTCRGLLAKREQWENREIELPGNPDYDASGFKGVPFKPDGDETCTGCGACVSVCPRGAISRENPRVTDETLCISCGACIRICPEKARDYHGEAYQLAGKGFAEKCAAYRNPETFYII